MYGTQKGTRHREISFRKKIEIFVITIVPGMFLSVTEKLASERRLKLGFSLQYFRVDKHVTEKLASERRLKFFFNLLIILLIIIVTEKLASERRLKSKLNCIFAFLLRSHREISFRKKIEIFFALLSKLRKA